MVVGTRTRKAAPLADDNKNGKDKSTPDVAEVVPKRHVTNIPRRKSVGKPLTRDEADLQSNEVDENKLSEVAPISRRKSAPRSNEEPQPSSEDDRSVGAVVEPPRVVPSEGRAVSTDATLTDPSAPSVVFEFGGPLGAASVIMGLPIVIYLLYFSCTKEHCITNPLNFDWSALWSRLTKLEAKDLFSEDAFMLYLSWMSLNVGLERLLPGELVEGVPLSDGSRLKYVMSGHLQFWLCLIAMFHSYPSLLHTENELGDAVVSVKGFSMPLSLDLIYDNYLQLITISIAASFLLSLCLYVRSFFGGELAAGGNTGYVVYDFFMGRELNPRLWSMDLKEFCELRPGLIGWVAINLGMAFKQYKLRGGSISMSMLLINLFQGIYVWDALYQEKAILTTMDITTDGFGFMLAFGDLAWVPFIYSFQARYLVDHDPHLPVVMCAAAALLFFLGFFIFRSSNSQKDAFRRDPRGADMAHMSFIQTYTAGPGGSAKIPGRRLMTGGWWGLARKINYTGDWLVTLSWCLLCGFDSPMPYFQAVYFLVLLAHRAARDDHMCAEKYGEYWTQYKKEVPYRFIPFVV